VPIVAGAGSNDTKKAIELSMRMRAAGATHLLHTSPMYNKPPQRGIVAHYRAIAEAVDLPIVIYNVPGRTGSNVEAKTTIEMAEAFQEGDTFSNVAGPLGNPTHIGVPGRPEDFRGTVVCVAGGIGAAPVLPIARAFKEAGHEVVTILGARRKDLLVFEDRLAAASSEVLVCTDDGSYGRKGFVTDVLKDLIEERRAGGGDVHLAIAIGPPIMMKFCAKATRPYGVPTLVSLNTIMVDGTGMCGGCRVMVDGVAKYVCVDGPEFDGHHVDFDGMMRRQAMYKPEEAASLERYRENDPSCQLQPSVAAAVSEA